MIKDLFNGYFIHLLTIGTLAYVVAKLSIIYRIGLRHKRASLLIESCFFYRKQTIRNTFYERLKQYYTVSNKINVAFYAITAALVLVYLFFVIIGHSTI